MATRAREAELLASVLQDIVRDYWEEGEEVKGQAVIGYRMAMY